MPTPPLTVGLRYLTVTAVSVVLVVAMTWPLGRLAPPIIPASDDANFSIWRLAWIAHQLPADPARIFDANIFHPATNTLALSDAMLLVGIAASPLFYMGMDPAHVHNRMLLAAIVLSMVCAFALARRLTRSSLAAFLAAIIFGLAPYRMAHIGHLELQWTMWMPLGMLLLHRLVEKPAPWRGALLGAAVAAQVLCSIYYGLFLACYLATAWLALVPFEKARARIVGTSAVAVVPLLLVAAIYGPPYAQTRQQFGDRGPDEAPDLQRRARRLPPRAAGKCVARPGRIGSRGRRTQPVSRGDRHSVVARRVRSADFATDVDLSAPCDGRRGLFAWRQRTAVPVAAAGD